MIFSSLMLLVSPFALAYELENIPFGDGKDRSDPFIRPNEQEFFRFNPVLEGKRGVLVAVGTFRFFHDLSMGEFDYGIGFDYSEDVYRFNLGLIRTFEQASSRYDFLARLLGAPDFIEDLKNFESGVLSGLDLKLRADAFLNRMRSVPRGFDGDNPYRTSVNLEQMRQFVQRLVKFVVEPRTRTTSFLGSDLLFERVKKMALEKRIFLVKGDLGKSSSLMQVALALREKKLRISVLDISNALSYVGYDSRPMLLQNLKALPFSKKAQVLLTQARGKFLQSSLDNWDYYAMPVSRFIGLLVSISKADKSGARKVEGAYQNFYRLFFPQFLLGVDRQFCVFIF